MLGQAPMPEVAVDAAVAEALGRVDLEAVRALYWRQNEFVCLERCLSLALVERLVAEVAAVRARVHRVRVPGKKSGSVSYHTLRRGAPAIVALYRTPALLDFLTALTGHRLLLCPDRDPHACALYVYTEPGDHITAHYDTSFYRDARYTVLVGLVNRTRSRLACQLFRGDPQRAPVDLEVATEPGTVVVFNGDKLWHAVTPLGRGEERVALTMQYVTTQAMAPFKRFVSDMKDAISYFGFREVFGR
jgi:alkylated DNA repair dioxygenase AlkB